jgi:hypothetical protein
VKKILKLLLGTSLYLLDQPDRATKHARGRVAGRVDGLRDLAQQKYKVTAGRFARAARAFRGSGEHRAIRNSLRFAAGVGIGVGVALLTAPSTGEQTRTLLAEKAQKLGGNVRRRFSSHDLAATGAGD